MGKIRKFHGSTFESFVGQNVMIYRQNYNLCSPRRWEANILWGPVKHCKSLGNVKSLQNDLPRS